MPEACTEPISIVPPLASDRETLLKVVGNAKDFKARLAIATINHNEDGPWLGISGKRSLVLLTPDKRRVAQILVDGLSEADAKQRLRLFKQQNAPTGTHNWN